jgi:hypothetical protein
VLTAGVAVGVAQYLGTLDAGYAWPFHAAVILAGVLVASPFGLLTVWLCRPADANREGATGVVEPARVPTDGGS